MRSRSCHQSSSVTCSEANPLLSNQAFVPSGVKKCVDPFSCANTSLLALCTICLTNSDRSTYRCAVDVLKSIDIGVIVMIVREDDGVDMREILEREWRFRDSSGTDPLTGRTARRENGIEENSCSSRSFRRCSVGGRYGVGQGRKFDEEAGVAKPGRLELIAPIRLLFLRCRWIDSPGDRNDLRQQLWWRNGFLRRESVSASCTNSVTFREKVAEYRKEY